MNPVSRSLRHAPLFHRSSPAYSANMNLAVLVYPQGFVIQEEKSQELRKHPEKQFSQGPVGTYYLTFDISVMTHI